MSDTFTRWTGALLFWVVCGVLWQYAVQSFMWYEDGGKMLEPSPAALKSGLKSD